MEKKINKGGRPTKYTNDYPEKVYEFLGECKEKDIIPLLIDFCRKVGLKQSEISKYANRYPRFNKAILALKTESESYLLHKGLARKVDPNFAKFILAANYGYVETSKTINEGNQPVTIQVDMSGGYVPPKTVTGPHKAIVPPPITTKSKPS